MGQSPCYLLNKSLHPSSEAFIGSLQSSIRRDIKAIQIDTIVSSTPVQSECDFEPKSGQLHLNAIPTSLYV